MLSIDDVHFPCGRALPWVVLGWHLLATDAHAREVPQSWSLVTGCIWAMIAMLWIACLQAFATVAATWIRLTYATTPIIVIRRGSFVVSSESNA